MEAKIKALEAVGTKLREVPTLELDEQGTAEGTLRDSQMGAAQKWAYEEVDGVVGSF